MRIAGTLTDVSWCARKKELLIDSSPAMWEKTFDEFLHQRIQTRYLDPIKAIDKINKDRGEGFSVVALFCTLFEFLEGCECGLNFDKAAKPGEAHKYGLNKGVIKGSQLFNDFLNREPFKTLLGTHISTFYSDVRCGLLHEARPCGRWQVRTSGPAGVLVQAYGKDIILYRDQLEPALDKYLAGYRARLSVDAKLQENFMTKWDHLSKP